MLDTLLESRALGERHASGHLFSIVTHGALIALAIGATHGVATTVRDDRHEAVTLAAPVEPPPPPIVRPVVPLAETPPPKGFQILIASIDIPSVLPAIDLSRPVTDPRNYTGIGAPGGVADGVDSVVRRPTRATYAESEVERPVAVMRGTETPDYPEQLKDAGIEGTVRVSFDVDTTGRAVAGTLIVLQTSHALFTEAVRKALSRMRFVPARIGAHAVRQTVVMPFEFRIRGLAVQMP